MSQPNRLRRERLVQLLDAQGEDGAFRMDALFLFDQADEKGKAEILELFEAGGRACVDRAVQAFKARRDSQ